MRAIDIGVSPNGRAFIVGAKKDGDGPDHEIFEWVGRPGSFPDHGSWKKMPGRGKRIAVGPDGRPWVVSAKGFIFKWDPVASRWAAKPGKASDIAVGANGDVWIVGKKRQSEHGMNIFKWDKHNKKWIQSPGNAIRISIDASGNPWTVQDKTNNLFKMEGGLWKLQGVKATDVGCGADGTIWTTGTAST